VRVALAVDQPDRPFVLVHDGQPPGRRIGGESKGRRLRRGDPGGVLGEVEQPPVGGDGPASPAQRDRGRIGLLPSRAAGARARSPARAARAATTRPVELGDGLDALGDEPRVEPRGEHAERFDHRGLRLVGVDARDQVAVDLHEVRAQHRDVLERGEPGACVVDREQRARRRTGAIASDRRAVVVHRGLLGDLDDDPAEVDRRGEDVGDRRGEQRLRTHVDGEEAVRRQRGPRPERAVQDLRLQFGAEARGVGEREPAVGADVRGPLEAGQRLVPGDRARAVSMIG
jgi:hypothetical protein